MKKLIAALLACTFVSGATAAWAQPTSRPAAPAPVARPAPVAPAPVARPAAPAPASPIPAPIPDADPAMWVVRDADTTVYLFGTFHLLDGRRDWFNDEVRTAFNASNELVMEVILPENPAEMQPLIMRYAVDPQGRTLSSRLTPQEMGSVRQVLGPIADGFDQAKIEPWFYTLTITTVAAQRLGLNPENGAEMILRNAARGRNMSVAALETVDFQLGLFDGMSEAAQLRGLRQTLAESSRLSETLQPMLDAWSTGNVDRLVTLTDESMREDPEFYRVLFTNRNAAWATWIRERMARPGTVFLAVGAGHLGGAGSVQDQLRGMNIQSARVPAAR